MLSNLIVAGYNGTPQQLDAMAEEYFLDHGTTPVFKGYHGFPASVCISLNNELVHGIPKDKPIEFGDIISLDTGCSYKGAITDSAITCGDSEIIQATYDCLLSGIREIKVGARVGAIGESIFHSARKKGYKVIEDYTGHGISLNNVHSDPAILNKDEQNKGVRMQSGMVIAIEPLLISNKLSTKTQKSSDGWTIIAEGLCAHHEHSILITDAGYEVLTRREDEDLV